MQKEKTANRKANSTRNRHNGRINAAKKHILNKGTAFIDRANNKPYTALIDRTWIQDFNAFLKDSDGSLTDLVDTSKGWWKITSTIVRGQA